MSSSFPKRATSWLRAQMQFQTASFDAPPTVDPENPALFRIDGTHAPTDESRSSPMLLLTLFTTAGVAAMLSARAGITPTIALSARVAAFAALAAGILVLMINARRARRARVTVHVVVVTTREAKDPALDAASIDRFVTGTRGVPWVVSETDFDETALARLRELGGRGFAVRSGRLTAIV
jgi:hypothetical protein